MDRNANEYDQQVATGQVDDYDRARELLIDRPLYDVLAGLHIHGDVGTAR